MRHLTGLLALALALSACATAPSSGEAPMASQAPAGLIDRYDEAALKSIFSELTYTVVDTSVSSSGKPFMTVETQGDAQFRVMGESCEGSGKEQVCRGVQLSTQFASPDGNLEELSARANRTLRPAKLFAVTAGAAYERYLIMEGGVSRENLKTNISVYVEILTALLQQL